MRSLSAVLIGLFLWLAALPADAQVQRTERIAAELVPMSQWAAPGSTAVVAVRQDIEPGWHTYWRNPGDSGGPTELDWTLPGGVEAGEIVWPLPERQRLQSLMNYGYSDQVYLPVPIEIPADAAPGSVLSLSVDALFMVCSDQMCVPDQLTLTLDLRVNDGEAPLNRAHGAVIARILETAPRPGDLTARVTRQGEELLLSVTGEALTDEGLSDVYFFPFEGGVIDHPADQPGERGTNGLSLSLTAGRAILTGGLNSPIAGVLSTSRGAWEIIAEVGEPLAGTTGEGALAEGAAPTGVGVFLQAALFALIGGVILNLMPCVFPILAMKAAALSASAHEPGEARRDGLAFLAGVLTTFLILAVALITLRAAGEAVGWGFQLQSPGVIAGLALLMLAVGLNLSGVFNVGMAAQGFAEGGAGGRLSRLPGGAGAFFTGVLAVVVAAPCTAPFMAFALGAALIMPAPMAVAVFLMLGLGLALPYVAVSLSPGLLKRFPRPGPWMDRLKGVLAFPMYGAALWLVWVFARQAGAESLALLMTGALMLALGLFLWGWRQAARAEGRGGAASTVAAVLSMVAAVGLTGAGASLARAPDAPGAMGGGDSALSSTPWSPEAVQAARAEGRVVFVNFTADWCVTCKINERAALASDRVRSAVETTGAVYMIADWTLRDDAIARELERHGRSGVPLYLVYRPGSDAPRILPQLLTPGLVAEALNDAA
ncbi:protein-disulfide reductase DsbD domain-containing protein [Brevundimonas sp.]|uniref:protein-disulfide reductase DsbD family protein n=2 Tax=Brevundimonas TaxID=41275 RepID=UPI00342CC7AD